MDEDYHHSSKIKPPTYDGKTSWQTYMKQFDAAANVNNWSESEKATALIVSLRGDALEILQTLNEDQHKNYEDLVLQLEMRFGDKHLQQVYQAQLKGRNQRINENLQQYEADIARLVYLAYPTAPRDFIEQLAVQVFIDGIRDCETQQALRLARCKKLNEKHCTVQNSTKDNCTPPKDSYSNIVQKPASNEINSKKVEHTKTNPESIANPNSLPVRTNNHKNRRNHNIVIGKKKSNDIKTIPRIGYLHVFRLAPEETIESLSTFLENSAPLIKFDVCEKLTRKDNLSASFKVSFPLSSVKEVYNPDIWPDESAVQRFKFLKNFPQAASQETLVQGT
ncbi:hypothetical protein NQ317_005944 [Molorchus minor]|uniref:Paraneoplastic antigen Ma-like C-terminal domain-containing protein n=1 Tax=Molorchus minor TaxID=1323400 RepID=A0ABQ9ISE8_9CUCU|nr:hypothetical protein NQ317_005944 [Molorchus minor]